MIGHAQMQQLVGDHKVLETCGLLGQVQCERDNAVG